MESCRCSATFVIFGFFSWYVCYSLFSHFRRAFSLWCLILSVFCRNTNFKPWSRASWGAEHSKSGVWHIYGHIWSHCEFTYARLDRRSAEALESPRCVRTCSLLIRHHHLLLLRCVLAKLPVWAYSWDISYGIELLYTYDNANNTELQHPLLYIVPRAVLSLFVIL